MRKISLFLTLFLFSLMFVRSASADWISCTWPDGAVTCVSDTYINAPGFDKAKCVYFSDYSACSNLVKSAPKIDWYACTVAGYAKTYNCKSTKESSCGTTVFSTKESCQKMIVGLGGTYLETSLPNVVPVPTYKCSGSVPTGQTKCPGTDSGLSKAAAWHLVASCNAAEKCEYYTPVSPPVVPSGPASSRCLCATDLSGDENALFTNFKTILPSTCYQALQESDCAQKLNIFKDNYLPKCVFYNSPDECSTKKTEWEVKLKSITEAAKQKSKEETSNSSGSSGENSILSSLISKCGENTLPSECKDITVFVSLAIQIVNYLFGIIGAIALGVFVYGGFQLILSQGNPEKVKGGTGAIINAVIGLVVAFSGYVLVSFLGELIGLNSNSGFTLLQ